jgi:hypothetical protein
MFLGKKKKWRKREEVVAISRFIRYKDSCDVTAVTYP